MTARSFGIPALDDRELVETIARTVAALGYSRLWINDTPMADGILAASWAAPIIPVGIGVIPIDRRPPDVLLPAIRDAGLAERDLMLGIGAGFSDSPVADVRRAIASLRDEMPELRIALAAMGPVMCRTAGAVADLALLNWMTPQRIEWARGKVGATPAAAYVRVATGVGAAERIDAEAASYAQMPHYFRHFEAMGGSRGVGVSGDFDTELAAYDSVLDETVVRALPMSLSISALAPIAEVGAP